MLKNKSRQPDVSVLMSVYNEAADAITVAVESILNQSHANFELIIINDNPTNVSTKKTLADISKRDARIVILTNDQNRGLGYSLNAAIKISRSNIIARMDTEDVSLPERLAKQISFLNHHSEVDLLFTQWIDVSENEEQIIRRPERRDFVTLKKSFFKKSLLMHPSLAARKQVMVENPYPEMDRPEDIVLWLKLIRQNYVFDIIEEPLYRYQVDRIKIEKRYEKVKTYSENLIPHLLSESRFYWHNIYFWLYFIRIIFEYSVSRNFTLFKAVHHISVKVWRFIFR